ncbi:hypothetical protein [Streptomyces orinoci]|uniref:Uncharacterized protein n=1 Tax=Streptomyces orinoci TaxID=67339 RepID=A0ABV3JR96_STRON|nr:hypothetical protein [Streptomyces orinoci]
MPGRVCGDQGAGVIRGPSQGSAADGLFYNLLHLRRPAHQAVAAPEKQALKAAFAPLDDATWCQAVLDRAREVFGQAFRGLG